MAQVDLNEKEGHVERNACNHHSYGGVACCALGHEAEVAEQQAELEPQYAADVALTQLDERMVPESASNSQGRSHVLYLLWSAI
jgi:hypothetical protein